MSSLYHDRPGWYPDPDDPRKLRYWDGMSWTGRARKQPPWVSKASPFEASCDDFDRSVEGPVHPRELREPVASGAWSREWLAWRGHAALVGGHRRGVPGGAGSPWRPARPQPSVKLGPARRPLLALVSLVVVAVAVVVSSVAVISPYEQRQVATQLATGMSFVKVASKDCRATLPPDRTVLAKGTDALAVAAAARQVDLLRRKLSGLPTNELEKPTVVEWLEAWQRFTASERRYAAATLAAAGRVSTPASGRGSQAALGAAVAARQEAHHYAALGDQLSSSLHVPACRLEPLT